MFAKGRRNNELSVNALYPVAVEGTSASSPLTADLTMFFWEEMTSHPLLSLTAVAAATLLGGVYFLQQHLIYPSNVPQGSRRFVDTPNMHGMQHYEDLTLQTEDGVKIRAYLILRPTEAESRKAATLLYLHANAGNMGHRLPIAREIYMSRKCNVLMLSYRGYGLSEGHASEKGMVIDAQTALNYILRHPILGKTSIVLYGQSIGGAVALNLASKNEDSVRAVIVENTFLSIPKLVPHVMPLLAYVAFLCHQRWESEKAIVLMKKTPILLLAGEKDQLVPHAHMKGLRDLCETKGLKVWKTFPNGTHNDTCMQPGYFEAIYEFWGRVV